MSSDFLHGHGKMALGTDHDHVVVDKKDWEEARYLLLHQVKSTVKLSRRNIVRLLAKLEAGRESYIIKPGVGLVIAEPDAVHYADRAPGQCSVETQYEINKIEACLELARKIKAFSNV